MNPAAPSSWVAIAQLLRPQGRRGELLAEPLSDLPEIFAAGRELRLAPPGSLSPSASDPIHNIEPRRIEAHWLPTGRNAGRIVLKLSGCDSIAAAEALAGHQALVAADSLPALGPDTFFVGDLLGCTLFDRDTPLGEVVDIEFATAPDGRTRLADAAPLLSIQPLGTRPSQNELPPVLVPFVRAWLETVDLPARRIVMHLPSGLFDEPTA